MSSKQRNPVPVCMLIISSTEICSFIKVYYCLLPTYSKGQPICDNLPPTSPNSPNMHKYAILRAVKPRQPPYCVFLQLPLQIFMSEKALSYSQRRYITCSFKEDIFGSMAILQLSILCVLMWGHASIYRNCGLLLMRFCFVQLQLLFFPS